MKMIEDKEEHEKMPVRKFFNNTFGTLLNDAIFALMKKQVKSKSNQIPNWTWQNNFPLIHDCVIPSTIKVHDAQKMCFLAKNSYF